jgi:hypothetical protein
VPDNMPDGTEPWPRWIDAFPWLEPAATSYGCTSAGASLWWMEPIDDNRTQRWERLADLSDLALECLTQWTIGQIFPALPDQVIVASLPMTNRAKNALARFGYQTAGDLQALELRDLLGLPQVGIGTVDSILQALADAATLTAETRSEPDRRISHRETPADRRGELPERAQPLVADLQQLARWYAGVGLPEGPILGGALLPGSPAEVANARQRLEQITASDVLVQAEARLDAAELLQIHVGSLDDRVQEILARRLFADTPDTLDVLGKDLGLTRERIRQIEGRARAALAEALEADTALCGIMTAVREVIGTVERLANVLSLMPGLGRPVPAAQKPAWRVLDRLDDGYEIKDGWCASPTIMAAQTEMLTMLHELVNRHGVATIGDLGPLNPNQSQESADSKLRDWLSYCGLMVDGDHVFTRMQSVGDRAAAILSVAGSPMSSQQILDRFGVERSLSSLRNAMGSDDRFSRVDRDKWSLAEWGLESYGGIRAVMRDEVAREGGRILMNTLIDRITGKYTVSANSVITYASAPPFEARDGVVRLALGERNVRKGPERTRRLYRRGDCWLYRVTVTKEHLRGSGFPAPVAIAVLHGVQPGQSRQLDSALGPLAVNWTGSQPAFGSILRFLVDSDIEIGNEIFLVLGDDGSFHIEPVDANGADALEHALLLSGCADEAARQEPRAALAAAIGLPEDSPSASVIGAYRERGDGDIADLLLSARNQLEPEPVMRRSAQSPDIDDILDLL